MKVNKLRDTEYRDKILSIINENAPKVLRNWTFNSESNTYNHPEVTIITPHEVATETINLFSGMMDDIRSSCIKMQKVMGKKLNRT